MRQFSTVFNDLLNLIPKDKLKRLLEEKKTDRYHKTCRRWNLFVAHLYAQIRGKDSLRDIEVGLNQHQSKWAHLGVKSIARSTLSDANRRTQPFLSACSMCFWTNVSDCQQRRSSNLKTHCMR